jgi:hypothetical protein
MKGWGKSVYKTGVENWIFLKWRSPVCRLPSKYILWVVEMPVPTVCSFDGSLWRAERGMHCRGFDSGRVAMSLLSLTVFLGRQKPRVPAKASTGPQVRSGQERLVIRRLQSVAKREETKSQEWTTYTHILRWEHVIHPCDVLRGNTAF